MTKHSHCGEEGRMWQRQLLHLTAFGEFYTQLLSVPLMRVESLQIQMDLSVNPFFTTYQLGEHHKPASLNHRLLVHQMEVMTIPIQRILVGIKLDHTDKTISTMAGCCLLCYLYQLFQSVVSFLQFHFLESSLSNSKTAFLELSWVSEQDEYNLCE